MKKTELQYVIIMIGAIMLMLLIMPTYIIYALSLTIFLVALSKLRLRFAAPEKREEIRNKHVKIISVIVLLCVAIPLSKGIKTLAEHSPVLQTPQFIVESDTVPAESTMVAESIETVMTPTPVPTEAPLPLSDFVTGIKDFSVIAGMNPNVMAGVQWDTDKIASISADTSGCDFTLPGTYEITYNLIGTDQRTEDKKVTVTVREDLEQFLYGMEGAVYVPVNGEFDPMENVVADDEIGNIEPDMSSLDTAREGEYLISYHLTSADGQLEQTAIRRIHVGEEPESKNAAVQTVPEDTGDYSTVTDLGLWRLTAYMDTPEDQGPYVGQTASGAPLVAGRTVAVSQATCERYGLVFGDRLMVDGHIYILEDHGGSAMYNADWVDIYVDNVEDEYSERFNRYSEVYLLR